MGFIAAAVVALIPILATVVRDGKA